VNFQKLGILLITLILLGSCLKRDRSGDSNTLKVPLSGEISTLDPANSYDTLSASVAYQCYEQLYEYHYLKRPYTVVPLLAESMPKIEDGGLRYTIKIKKNIRYHDNPVFKGKPRFVKAEDFITQIKRLAYIPTKSNGWWLFDDKIKGINDWRYKVGNDFEKFKSIPIPGLKAIDDHTLVFELVKPYPQMMYGLTLSFSSPIPLEVVEEYNNILNDHEVGTGPYILKEWTKGLGIKLVRNKDYRDAFYPTEGDRLANSKGLLKDANKKIPFVDNIHYKIIKESQPRWLNFRKQNIDFLNIPKDNYHTAIESYGGLKKDLIKDGIELEIFPTLTFWWLSFNMEDELVGKNKNLRLAIAHAIDMDRYIKIFTNNLGLKANSIYPPGIPGYQPSHKLPYVYSLEKAKDYLTKAGYPGGKKLPVINFDERGTSLDNKQRADFVKQQLAKIGIKVKIITNSFPAFLKKAKEGKLQFWQDGWAMDYPDAENILQLLISRNRVPGPNVTNYSNPKFDQFFEELKILPQGKGKVLLMKKMEKTIQDDLPWIMQHYARNYILLQKRLKNYRHSDLVYNYFKYLRLEGQ
jgi:oligopeptide transport system substrate-binding protein